MTAADEGAMIGAQSMLVNFFFFPAQQVQPRPRGQKLETGIGESGPVFPRQKSVEDDFEPMQV